MAKAQAAIVDPADRITRARRLAALRHEFTDRILDAENDVLTRVSAEYQGETLTPQAAYAAIAEITALRRLLSGIETDARTAEHEGNI